MRKTKQEVVYKTSLVLCYGNTNYGGNWVYDKTNVHSNQHNTHFKMINKIIYYLAGTVDI